MFRKYHFINLDKLSIIGDFGYVYESYSIDQFSQRFNVGLEKFSSQSTPIDIIGSHYQLNDTTLVNKLLEKSAQELRRIVLENRSEKIKPKGISQASFEENVLKGGSLVPSDAVKLGLIDGLQNCEHFISISF